MGIFLAIVFEIIKEIRKRLSFDILLVNTAFVSVKLTQSFIPTLSHHRPVSFIVLLGLIIIAFAHALFVLLRTYEVTETLPTFKGNILQNGTDTAVNQLQFQQIPESDTDLFRSFREALQAVYFFIDGEWGTIEGFHSNVPLIIFRIIFSFLTGIVLLNILIALMAEVYGECGIVIIMEPTPLCSTIFLTSVRATFPLPIQARRWPTASAPGSGRWQA